MTWKTQLTKWNWREFLTPDEQREVSATDKKLAEIERLRLEIRKSKRRPIINRAIKRAQYAAENAK